MAASWSEKQKSSMRGMVKKIGHVYSPVLPVEKGMEGEVLNQA